MDGECKGGETSNLADNRVCYPAYSLKTCHLPENELKIERNVVKSEKELEITLYYSKIEKTVLVFLPLS